MDNIIIIIGKKTKTKTSIKKIQSRFINKKIVSNFWQKQQ